MKLTKEEQRIAALELCVKRLFSNLGPDEIDRLAENYSETATEMFEVKELQPESSVLQHFFEDGLEFWNVSGQAVSEIT